MRSVFIGLFVLLSAGLAQAQPRDPLYGGPPDFLGIWHNVEVRRTQVVRIVIHHEFENNFHIEVFGLCGGEPCFFGDYHGRLFAAPFPRDREADNAAILVRVHRDFVHGNVLIRFNGRGEIVTHALLHYEDGRGDLYCVERFAPLDRDYGGDGDRRESRY